jgi:hypothetical protein
MLNGVTKKSRQILYSVRLVSTSLIEKFWILH